MKKRRWPKRLLLVVLLLVAALLGGVVFLLHSAYVSEQIRAKVVSAANELLAGKVEVKQLQLDGDQVLLRGVKLYDPEGELVAEVDELTATVDLPGLTSGKINVQHLKIHGAFVDLSHDDKGLKISRAVAPKVVKAKVEQVKKASSINVVVDDFELEGVKVRANDPSRDDALRELAVDVGAKGSVHYKGPPDRLDGSITLDGNALKPATDPLHIELKADGAPSELAGKLKLTLGEELIDGTFDLGKKSAQLAQLKTGPKWGRVFLPQLKLKRGIELHGSLSPEHVVLDGDVAGTLHLDATLSGLGTPKAQVPKLQLTLSKVKVDELLEDVGPTTIDAKIEGSLSDPTPLAATGELTMTAHVVTQPGAADVALTSRAVKGTLKVEPLKVSVPGTHLEIRGDASLQRLALDGTLKVDDLAKTSRFGAELGEKPPPEVTGNGTLAVHVAGSPKHPAVALDGNFPLLTAGENRLRGVAVKANVPDVRLPRQAQLNLDIASADFGSNHVERFNADLALSDGAFSGKLTAEAAEQVTVSFGGELAKTWDAIGLNELALTYPGTEWKLAGPTRIDWQKSDWHLDPLTLQAGGQTLFLKGDQRVKKLDAEVKLTAFDLARLPKVLRQKLEPAGTVDLALIARGAVKEPDVDFDLDWKNGKLGDLENLGLKSNGKLSKGRVVAQLNVSSTAGNIEGHVDAALKWKDQSSAVELKVEALDLGEMCDALHKPRQLEGKVQAVVKFDGTLDDPKATVSLSSTGIDACALPGCMSDAPRLKFTAIGVSLDVEHAKPITLHAGFAVLDGNLQLTAQTPATLAQLAENKNGGAKEAPLDATLIINNLALVKLAEQGITDSVIDQKLALKAHLTGNALHPDLEADLDTIGVPPGNTEVPAAGGTPPKDEAQRTPFLLSTHLELRTNRQQVAVTGWGKLGAIRAIALDGKLTSPLERIASATGAPLELRADLGPLELNTFVPKSRFGREPTSLGSVAARLSVHGTADQPVGKLEAFLKDLHFEKVNLGQMNVTWDYAEAKHKANIDWTSPAGGALHAKAGLDLDIGVASVRKGLQVRKAPFTARVDAEHFDLSAGSGLSTTVRKLGGILDAKIEGGGTFADPHLNGQVEWVRGKLSSSYGDYREVRLSMEMDEKHLELKKLYAKAGEGDADVSALIKRNGDTIDISALAKLKDLPIVADDQLYAIVTAETQVNGTRSADTTELKVKLPDTHVQLPSVKRKDLQDLGRPKDIVLVRGSKKLEKKKPDPSQQNAPPKQKGERLAMFIDAPRNIWVKSDDLNIELGLSDGFEVDLNNGAQLFGEARIVQGRLDVLSRRFDVQRDSMVRFQGQPASPYINVTANYTNESEGVVVTVTVVGKGKDLSLKTSSQPPLSDNEIFALLATGRRTLKRGGGSSISAGQAASVVGAFAASQLKTMVAKKLPLDVLSIDTGEEGLERAKVEAGTYLSTKLYLGYQLQLGADKTKGENEHAVRLEYQLTKNWTVEGSAGDAPAASGDVMWSRDY